MTYIAKPKFRHPKLATNRLGLSHRDYEGLVSTLCAGCGHDSVSAAIMDACFRLDISPHRVAKVSGIGCSSKTTNYFLGRSHGFNSVHGRMPSVATGAYLANPDLIYIGISGDGDTASIGLGQFCHAMRRRLNMVYIVENNGTYGLTKGQFSATNDQISEGRKGKLNPFDSIDLCSLAIEIGAGFVARAFSGDKAQLVPLIEAAIRYRGFSFIDVISPCVTFNNHTGSTKSYDYVRDHNQAMEQVDFVAQRDEIRIEQKAGATTEVTLHDGSAVRLHSLADDYNPGDPDAYASRTNRLKRDGTIATGLLYLDEAETELRDLLALAERPLNSLEHSDLCPSAEALEAINKAHR